MRPGALDSGEVNLVPLIEHLRLRDLELHLGHRPKLAMRRGPGREQHLRFRHRRASRGSSAFGGRRAQHGLLLLTLLARAGRVGLFLLALKGQRAKYRERLPTASILSAAAGSATAAAIGAHHGLFFLALKGKGT